MKVQELADAIRNITEDSVKKLKIESWISVELGRIVNRKPYHWRQAVLSFDCVATTPTYNLSDIGTTPLNLAPDFLQFATPLYEFQGTQKVAELPFVSDSLQTLQMIRDTTTGTPAVVAVEPGTTKTLRLSPIPAGVHSYSAIYYREAVIDWNTANQDEIPIIPSAFHYVLYQAMERRAFFYLYGQKDPRATIAAQAEAQCLADLDSYRAGSTLVVPEWRSGDPCSFIQSTS